MAPKRTREPMDVDPFPGLEARIAKLTGDDMADTSAEDARREENFKKADALRFLNHRRGLRIERVRVRDKTRWEPVLTMEQLAEICRKKREKPEPYPY